MVKSTFNCLQRQFTDAFSPEVNRACPTLKTRKYLMRLDLQRNPRDFGSPWTALVRTVGWRGTIAQKRRSLVGATLFRSLEICPAPGVANVQGAITAGGSRGTPAPPPPPHRRLALPQGWPVFTTCREPGRPRPNLLGRSVPGGCPVADCPGIHHKFANCERWQRIVGCVERTAREMMGCARSRTLENA